MGLRQPTSPAARRQRRALPDDLMLPVQGPPQPKELAHRYDSPHQDQPKPHAETGPQLTPKQVHKTGINMQAINDVSTTEFKWDQKPDQRQGKHKAGQPKGSTLAAQDHNASDGYRQGKAEQRHGKGEL